MTLALITLGIVLAAVAFALTSKARPSSKGGAFTYAARPLFHSAAERSTYETLRRELPELIVAPQVCMSAFLKVSGRDAFRGRGFIKARYVDLLLADRSGKPLLVIELDGPTHDTREGKAADADRDALIASAGLKVLRLRSGAQIDMAAVKAYLPR